MKWQLALLVLFLLPGGFAHLEGGEDRTVNGALIDFGWSPAPLYSASSASFSLTILNATSEQPFSENSAWVRVAQGDDILFAGVLSLKEGSAAFSVLPRSSSPVEVTVRSQGIESVFIVPVTATQSIWLVAGGILCVLGMLGGAFRT
jgi:hypothetical protein